jgi:hypothetical protein
MTATTALLFALFVGFVGARTLSEHRGKEYLSCEHHEQCKRLNRKSSDKKTHYWQESYCVVNYDKDHEYRECRYADADKHPDGSPYGPEHLVIAVDMSGFGDEQLEARLSWSSERSKFDGPLDVPKKNRLGFYVLAFKRTHVFCNQYVRIDWAVDGNVVASGTYGIKNGIVPLPDNELTYFEDLNVGQEVAISHARSDDVWHPTQNQAAYVEISKLR